LLITLLLQVVVVEVVLLLQAICLVAVAQVDTELQVRSPSVQTQVMR
jgi:hypothetical protein